MDENQEYMILEPGEIIEDLKNNIDIDPSRRYEIVLDTEIDGKKCKKEISIKYWRDEYNATIMLIALTNNCEYKHHYFYQNIPLDEITKEGFINKIKELNAKKLYKPIACYGLDGVVCITHQQLYLWVKEFISNFWSNCYMIKDEAIYHIKGLIRFRMTIQRPIRDNNHHVGFKATICTDTEDIKTLCNLGVDYDRDCEKLYVILTSHIGNTLVDFNKLFTCDNGDVVLINSDLFNEEENKENKS